MLWCLIASVAVVACLGCRGPSDYRPVSGDIIFQTSTSGQSRAIQLATGSAYSHLGLVHLRGGDAFVFEAVEPVRSTPLAEWIARGEGGAFVVKRLKNSSQVLTPEALARMLAVGEGFVGKPYDLYFEWSDDRIYCSELVWKIYQRALGLEIGAPATLGSFDLSPPPVRAKLAERWGAHPPLAEPVISPAAMFASDELVEVYRRGAR
ncbi:MAG: YiiX family permuted papain-like enzyme [Candidatus Krumholzibacteriia bacterium]